MAAINSDRASLGLAFDAGKAPSPTQPTIHIPPTSPTSKDGPPQAQLDRRRSSAPPLPPPIITEDNGFKPLHSSVSHNDLAPSLSPHRSTIPPPPSPRRHRAGAIMQRVRAHSGGHTSGFGSSKSFGDLRAMGLSMTSSTSRSDRRSSMDVASGERPVLSDSPVVEEPVEEAWDGDAGALDNSARFYHRLHASSRAASPTRSNASVSPNRRSVSPGHGSRGGSPIFVRRNLTLPAGAGQHAAGSSPGATLSATLSPNSRFLQQHLPPLFSLSSPESEADNPMAHAHPMLILTPTTQDWRELKAMGGLEGDNMGCDSDSGSSSSRSPSPPPPATQIVVQEAGSPPEGKKEFAKGPEEASLDPHPPVRPGFEPGIIGTPPGGWTQNHDDGSNVVEEGRRNDDIVLGDLDQTLSASLSLSAINDTPGRPAPIRRFNSIGRRDSLVVRERPAIDLDAPRQKTKRELERERLFRMVDQEIAEDGPGPTSRSSWGVLEIGGGLSTPPMTQTEFSPPLKATLPSDKSAMTVTPEPTPSPDETPTRPSLATQQFESAATIKPSPLHEESMPPETPSPPPLGEAIELSESPPLTGDKSPPHDAPPETESERFEAIRNYSRSVSTRRTLSRMGSRAPSRRGSYEDPNTVPSPPRSPRRRDTNRVSLVAGRVVQPFSFPGLAPLTSMNKDAPKGGSLQSFSPFRAPEPKKAAALGPPSVPAIEGLKGNVSHAPSTAVPSECATPSSETAGGIGGHGIDDYVILKEAGKGAYGLVMRAKAKGANGEPVGEEVIIKYVIKSRILADCWKKHKVLGPIPVEIHVMDQLRHLIYHPPVKRHPWDPHRPGATMGLSESAPASAYTSATPSRSSTPLSTNSYSGPGDTVTSPTQRYLEVEIKHSPERGHPNICKLLDFFEDREFYYLVMPRYGTGVDLFDRVESQPAGLDPFEVRSLIGQLTDAVRFLHTNGIVHRDIKDENVILDGDGRCQLIDFGSAAHWRPGKRWDTFSGTLHYASPEIMRGEMYSGKEQDIWALGTVAYVLLVGETPFAELPDEVLEGLSPGSRALEALDARCGGIHFDEGREADGGGALGDAADFVHRCLEQDLADRPTADALLTHKFLIGNGGWTGRRGWIKSKT